MRNWYVTRPIVGLLTLGLGFACGLAGQTAGYSAPWDVSKLTAALTTEAQRLQPIVVQADPQKWKDAKAGQNYQQQWNSAQNLIQYFTGSAERLSSQPERLPLAMEAYFRMEAMQTVLASLADGIRRHDNPAKADLIESVMNDNSNNRERLKQYLTDLATVKEQEFQVADREAQRCRGNISRQAPAAPDHSKAKR
jgi:hypothetical protein